MRLSKCSLAFVIYILLVVGVTMVALLTPLLIEQVLLGSITGVGSLVTLYVLVFWAVKEDHDHDLLEFLEKRLGCRDELYDP